MAKLGGASQPSKASKSRAAKPSRAEKKLARGLRKQKRRETFRNLKQAFSMTRKSDKRLVPYLIIAFLGAAAVMYLLTSFFFGLWLPIPFALLAGFIAAMVVFNRRAQKSMYAEAENQPGAAAWLLQNQVRGDWRTTPAVAGNSHLDAVHRMVGRPGIVLVGEGAPHRTRGLVAQEKKKIARIAGDTPIYDVLVGNGDGLIPMGKLNAYLVKLPRNLSKGEVATLEKRLAALGGVRAPLPQGPMPQGAKMRNVQRTVRRRT